MMTPTMATAMSLLDKNHRPNSGIRQIILVSRSGSTVYKGEPEKNTYKIIYFKYNKTTMTCSVHNKIVSYKVMVDLINSESVYVINSYLKCGTQVVIRRFDINDRFILKIAMAVREQMETLYGVGTDLAGHCIEASETIAAILTTCGAKCKVVEGWCEFDDEYYGSDRPYDPHTWVEIGKVYLDVTADQFNPGMYPENKYPPVLVNLGLPHGMSYREPIIWED